MSSDFWKGVGVTLAVLAGFTIVPDIIAWVGNNPVLDRLAYWLTAPLFSIADMVMGVLILSSLYVVVYYLAFGPRP